MLRNIASNDCSNMANKLTKRKILHDVPTKITAGIAGVSGRENILYKRDETNIT